MLYINNCSYKQLLLLPLLNSVVLITQVLLSNFDLSQHICFKYHKTSSCIIKQ